MELNLQIKTLRIEQGLTQQDLAEMVGISKPHMSEVERGKKNLNNHLILKISHALGVHPADLFSENSLAGIIENLSDQSVESLLTYAEGLLAGQESASD